MIHLTVIPEFGPLRPSPVHPCLDPFINNFINLRFGPSILALFLNYHGETGSPLGIIIARGAVLDLESSIKTPL